MLVKFKCKNFKGFKDLLTFDLNSRDYNFNEEIIKNGVINKAIIYGKNGSGKSNLGIALFDIIHHLTDKQRLPQNYMFNYLNLSSKESFAEFEYEFKFGKDYLVYSYRKQNVDLLISEKLTFNNKLIIDYDFFDNEKRFIDTSVKKDLNINLIDNKLSIIKYIYRNTPEEINSPITKLVKFVEGMLWYRSLSDGNNYAGFLNGSASLDEALYLNGKIHEFENFLKTVDLEYKLKFLSSPNGHQLFVDFGSGKIAPFSTIASTGTNTLYLFFYRKQFFNKVTFLFIDEFDAFLHYEAAENIIKFLNEQYNCQSLLTTHNTYFMKNELTRPDCCFIISNNQIKSLVNCTNKEIREAHNLEKMYINGAFNG